MVGERRGKQRLTLTSLELSLTAAREMDRAKEGKVCKAHSAGAAKRRRGVEEKSSKSRGQRLVAGGEPRGRQAGLPLEIHHACYIVLVCFGSESERPFIIQGD